jgi:L-threonylcarbamoyladenylate synthase
VTGRAVIKKATPETIAQAAALLQSGALVAFPTETVYGLGADATSDDAVAGIFEAKQRPTFNPLIVHVTGIQAAAAIVDFTGPARRLADAFWPGPLSLVLPRRDTSTVSLLASAGLDTIAVRVPDQTTAQAILAACGIPVAAPSANASGRISPTRAAHVAESLGDAVAMIVDDGPCPIGVESTVVDCSGDTPVLLRPGGITAEEIEAVIGPLAIATDNNVAPSSPGMLESHYAPDAALRLNAISVHSGEALLSFGRHQLTGFTTERNLSPAGDLREAAANLFAMMRELDACENAIAAMPIPNQGIGRAINDRLRRAAAPRNAA